MNSSAAIILGELINETWSAIYNMIWWCMNVRRTKLRHWSQKNKSIFHIYAASCGGLRCVFNCVIWGPRPVQHCGVQLLFVFKHQLHFQLAVVIIKQLNLNELWHGDCMHTRQDWNHVFRIWLVKVHIKTLFQSKIIREIMIGKKIKKNSLSRYNTRLRMAWNTIH